MRIFEQPHNLRPNHVVKKILAVVADGALLFPDQPPFGPAKIVM
jgi:hypothetical protein